MVIVDTSAWIEFFRRDGDLLAKLAVKALIDEFEATLCGPVEMEFLGGARPHEKAEIAEAFDIMPYVTNDQKLWRKAAGVYAQLRKSGLTVPWNDVLIATIAKEKLYRVYSVDKHFTSMAKILPDLILYEPGYNGMFNPEE
ncbi:MAG: PIN domain-containing protein [Verrucomicrobiota bacterium]